MHETALVAGILRIVGEEAARHKAGRVTGVTLQVGLLAAVEPCTLGACFEIHAAGTCAEGARLTVETVPMRGVCLTCGAPVVLNTRRFACPSCGADNLDLAGGNEMIIAAIEAQPYGGIQP